MIPEIFAQTIREVYGPAGAEWLARLPLLLAECADRWGLTFSEPFPNLSYNYVIPAGTTKGQSVVLKCGVPNRELSNEMVALAHYGGRGSVPLLEADPALGVMLLARLRPGTPLSHLPNDDEATLIAAEVMANLWCSLPAGHTFPTIADWGQGFHRLRQRFNGTTGPFPAHLVTQAEQLYTQLTATMADPVLLHGDLHHDNILAAGPQLWLAIDPKGLVGEAAYETGALLRNPDWLFKTSQPHQILNRRVTRLAQSLGLAPGRIIGWGMAQAVLSGWWHYEDHGYGWEPTLHLAQWLADLL